MYMVCVISDEGLGADFYGAQDTQGFVFLPLNIPRSSLLIWKLVGVGEIENYTKLIMLSRVAAVIDGSAGVELNLAMFHCLSYLFFRLEQMYELRQSRGRRLFIST